MLVHQRVLLNVTLKKLPALGQVPVPGTAGSVFLRLMRLGTVAVIGVRCPKRIELHLGPW